MPIPLAEIYRYKHPAMRLEQLEEMATRPTIELKDGDDLIIFIKASKKIITPFGKLTIKEILNFAEKKGYKIVEKEKIMQLYDGERRTNLNDLFDLGFKESGKITIGDGENAIKLKYYGHRDIGFISVLAFYPVIWIGNGPDMTSVQLRIYDRSFERWEDYIRSPRQLENWYIYKTGKRI